VPHTLYVLFAVWLLLAESVSKAEFESVKAGLQAKIKELEERLAASTPKAEAEARIRELETKLAESVPKSELEAAKARIKELEAALAARPVEEKPTEGTS